MSNNVPPTIRVASNGRPEKELPASTREPTALKELSSSSPAHPTTPLPTTRSTVAAAAATAIVESSPNLLEPLPSLSSTPKITNRVIKKIGDPTSNSRLTSVTAAAAAASHHATTNSSASLSEALLMAAASSTTSRPLPLPKPKHPSKCPLFCCFYAVFDNKVGPKVSFQSPPNFIDREVEIPVDRIHTILADAFERIRKKRSSQDNNRSSVSNTQTPPKTLQESSRTIADDSNPPPSSMDQKTEPADKDKSYGGDDDVKDGDKSNEISIPEHSLSIFDSCSEYIITGSELTGNIINVSTHHIHCITRPTIIHDNRYKRNSLLFCVGFVLRRREDPRPFHPVLSKLALTLCDMEMESQFLSNETTRPRLQTILEDIFVSLNSSQWECNQLLSPVNFLNLKLFHPPKSPAFPVPDHAVPVLLRRDWQVQMYDWDLSINWVSLHIDGINNARQISKKAEVDMEMVRACLRVLKHHGVITLVDMFFFTNRYEPTSKAAALLTESDSKRLNEAVDFVMRRPAVATAYNSSPDASPTLQASTSPLQEHNTASSVFPMEPKESVAASLTRRREYNDVKAALAELYCSCNRNVSIGDLWIELVSRRFSVGSSSSSIDWKKIFHLIDHRRFTSFGLVHGLLKRAHNFPFLIEKDGSSSDEVQKTSYLVEQTSILERSRSVGRNEPSPIDLKRITSKVASMMNGRHCDDELACAFERPLEELFDLFEGCTVVSVYATETVC